MPAYISLLRHTEKGIEQNLEPPVVPGDILLVRNDREMVAFRLSLMCG